MTHQRRRTHLDGAIVAESIFEKDSMYTDVVLVVEAPEGRLALEDVVLLVPSSEQGTGPKTASRKTF